MQAALTPPPFLPTSCDLPVLEVESTGTLEKEEETGIGRGTNISQTIKSVLIGGQFVAVVCRSTLVRPMILLTETIAKSTKIRR
jgi:hypothetical protein